VVRIHVGECAPPITTERVTRRTTDIPAQRSPRTGIDLSALARRHATALRLAYLACITIATLLHLGVDTSVTNAAFRLQRALDPQLGFRDIVDAARNVALFIGWGATWVLTSDAPSTRRDVAVATLAGMMASLTVETAQLYSQYRTASVADVFTNTLGALIGALALWLMEKRAIADMRRGTLIGIPAWLPASAMLMTAFGLAFAPSSRASMIVAYARSPLERAAIVAGMPAVDVLWTALVTDVAVWFAVGIAASVAISDRTGRVRGTQLVAWLAIVSALLAVAHWGRSLAGLQRESGSWIVQGAAAATGLLIGLALVPRWRALATARSTRAYQLAGVAAVVGVIMSWVPASWAASAAGGPSFSWRQLVPMMSLFQRQDLSSVFLVLQKAGLGAAVGACLAARTRVGVPHPGVRAAVLYATVLELGQLFVPGRYPDVTDILITVSAASLVAVLVERADAGTRNVLPSPDLDLKGSR
jgi:VanZ family protein